MKRFLRALIPAALLVLGSALLPAGSVLAQDAEEKVPGPLVGIGEDLWRAAQNCWDCHGNMGNGRNEDPRSPAGADFRETLLTTEQIAEAIRCGRIGTPMPFFGRNAYTGDRSCFGLQAADLGDQLPPEGGPTLNTRQTDALAQFIWFYFAGRGPATMEECLEFYGANASSCNRWPTQAEVDAAAAG